MDHAGVGDPWTEGQRLQAGEHRDRCHARVGDGRLGQAQFRADPVFVPVEIGPNGLQGREQVAAAGLQRLEERVGLEDLHQLARPGDRRGVGVPRRHAGIVVERPRRPGDESAELLLLGIHGRGDPPSAVHRPEVIAPGIGPAGLGLLLQQDHDVVLRHPADRRDPVAGRVVQGRVAVAVPDPLGLRHLGPEFPVDLLLAPHRLLEEGTDPQHPVLLGPGQLVALHQADEVFLGPAFRLVLDPGGTGVEDPPVYLGLLGELGEPERPQRAECQAVPFPVGHRRDEPADGPGALVGERPGEHRVRAGAGRGGGRRPGRRAELGGRPLAAEVQQARRPARRRTEPLQEPADRRFEESHGRNRGRRRHGPAEQVPAGLELIGDVLQELRPARRQDVTDRVLPRDRDHLHGRPANAGLEVDGEQVAMRVDPHRDPALAPGHGADGAGRRRRPGPARSRAASGRPPDVVTPDPQGTEGIGIEQGQHDHPEEDPRDRRHALRVADLAVVGLPGPPDVLGQLAAGVVREPAEPLVRAPSLSAAAASPSRRSIRSHDRPTSAGRRSASLRSIISRSSSVYRNGHALRRISGAKVILGSGSESASGITVRRA